MVGGLLVLEVLRPLRALRIQPAAEKVRERQGIRLEGTLVLGIWLMARSISSFLLGRVVSYQNYLPFGSMVALLSVAAGALLLTDGAGQSLKEGGFSKAMKITGFGKFLLGIWLVAGGVNFFVQNYFSYFLSQPVKQALFHGLAVMSMTAGFLIVAGYVAESQRKDP
jgi:hypothetical protein